MHGGAVVQQVSQPVDRMGRVQGQVGGAGFEHGEEGHDEVGAAGQADGDDAVRAGAVGDEVVGELVRAAVQGGVGERAGAVGDGDRVRGGERLGVHEGGDVGGRDRVAGGAAEGGEPGALAGVQQRQAVHRVVGRGQRRLEEGGELVGETLGGVDVEEVAVVGEARPQFAGRARFDGQVERERGRAGVQFQGPHAHAGQGGRRGRGVAHPEHHLEQRVGGEVAARSEVLDEFLERHLLVGIGVQAGVADLAQQLPEGEPGREPVRMTRVLTKKPMSLRRRGGRGRRPGCRR